MLSVCLWIYKLYLNDLRGFIVTCVYAGGQLNSTQVWRFMAQLNQWVSVGSLLKGRWRHKMASLCGKVCSISHTFPFLCYFQFSALIYKVIWVCLWLQLYAIGGYDGEQRLSSVECYSVFENVWKPVAPMLLPVSSAALASCSGKLYVISGAVTKDCNTSRVRLQTFTYIWGVAGSSLSWVIGALGNYSWNENKEHILAASSLQELQKNTPDYKDCVEGMQLPKDMKYANQPKH